MTLLMYSQRRFPTRGASPLKHPRRQQRIQVVTVDPFHFQHADASPLDEVLDVEQIVVLNQRDTRADLGHSLHRFVVAALVDIALRREKLQGYRQGEIVAAPPLAEVNNTLAATT